MSYDYSKLSGKIVECYATQGEFAKAIGLSERSVSLKLNNKREWTQDEMLMTCELLGVPNADIPSYFFKPKVQN